MIDLVYENLRKATDATVQFQQELFRKWTESGFGSSESGAWVENVQKSRKKANAAFLAMLKKHRETLDVQFEAGMQHLEETLHVSESANIEELRTKLMELWAKSFDSLHRVSEVQVQEFQAALAKCAEVATAGAM